MIDLDQQLVGFSNKNPYRDDVIIEADFLLDELDTALCKHTYAPYRLYSLLRHLFGILLHESDYKTIHSSEHTFQMVHLTAA